MNDAQQNADSIVAEALAAAGGSGEADAGAAMEDAIEAAPEAVVAPAGPAQAAFAELDATFAAGGEVPMSLLMDLTLPVSIELGRTSMTVQEILRLGKGAVIQLERLAGEPVDVYVGERRFAEGEVVVLGEHFGVRITRIVSRLTDEAA